MCTQFFWDGNDLGGKSKAEHESRWGIHNECVRKGPTDLSVVSGDFQGEKQSARLLVEHRQNPADPLPELVRGRDQAEHEVSVSRKIVEVPRMHEHGNLAQQLDSLIFI